MYQSATITIDPRGVSQIRRRPTKGFRRFAELLTCNLLSTKEEHETFTALSIMQEINVVLRSLGVTDVVKFSKDGTVLYEDVASASKDDMEQAISSISSQRLESRTPSSPTHAASSGAAFDQLSLLLEHHLSTLALILEIKILRVHDIGVYPIQISVNGLDAQMQSSDLGTLNSQLDAVFASQQSYDAYAESKKAEFAEFVDQLENAFRTRMQLENLHRRIYTNVVRPGLKPASSDSMASGSSETQSANAPMLSRFHGTSDSLMYLWMWSSFMHSNNIYCHDTTIVNESGAPAFSVGEAGFNAGESTTLDPEHRLKHRIARLNLLQVWMVRSHRKVTSTCFRSVAETKVDRAGWTRSRSEAMRTQAIRTAVDQILAAMQVVQAAVVLWRRLQQLAVSS